MNIVNNSIEKQSLSDNIFKREQDKTFETLLNAKIENNESSAADIKDFNNPLLLTKNDNNEIDIIKSANFIETTNINQFVNNLKINSDLESKIQVKDINTPINHVNNSKKLLSEKTNKVSSLITVQVPESNKSLFNSFLYVKKDNKLFISKNKLELIQKNGTSIFNLFKEFGIKISKLVVSGKQVEEK